MAGSAVALRSWVATTRLTAGKVTGRTVEEAGRLFALAPPLQVIRPADLLVLEFQFINLRRSGARLIRANAGRPAYLIATHQFQSVGEEAFPEITGANQTKMEADQNLKGRKNPPQSAGVTPASLPPQAKVRAAGSSRLVYEAPAGVDGLDWTLPSLLEACRTWPLFLDGSAQPDPGDLRYHGVVKLGWISRDLRSTVTLTREALGERLSTDGRAALDRVAAELARSGLAAARDAAPNQSGLLARRASAAIRQLLPVSGQQEEGRVDHVAAAIYVRAQASRRALIDVQRGGVSGVFDLARLPPEIFIDFLKPDPPGEHETALEMPYRLIASPLKTAGFTHALAPVTHGGRTELWHSRMGTRLLRDGQVHVDDRPGAPTDSGGWKGEKLRFIWSPDYRKDTQDGFRKPLDKLDRQMLVKLTAGYDEKRQDGVTPFTPRAAYVRRLMLTALGGDLEAHRKFDPRPQGVDLSAWTHRAAIGRDYFVRVEYSGFLFPFGHRATLVKLTERKFQWRDPAKQDDRVAFLRQRFFIVVRDKVIDYPGGSPQPHAGRSLPFVQVACAVDVTPDLAPPGSAPADRLPADFYSEQIEAEFRQAFWPSRGGGVDYRFPMVGTDQAGRKIAFDMPLIFMSELRNCSPHIGKVAVHWNGAASATRRVAPLGGQSVRMAPASAEAADVDVPLIDAEIRAIAPTSAIGATPAAKLQQFPRFGQSTAKLAAIERLIGQPREDKIAFYEPFLATGLGAGDLFARIVGPAKLSFGSSAPSDAVGAIATPDITPSGLSARHGVASGPLASFGANSFNPSDFFPDAKLLGFINKVAANLYRDPALNLLGVAEKVKALINAHVSARGVDPKIPPTTITDSEFEKVLQAQTSSRARAAQMQHAARYHISGFSNQNPAYARKMSERLNEILQRFKDDWDALERELGKFIEELRKGDRNEFPDLDPRVQVPFVRLILEECGKGRELSAEQRLTAISATLDMVERIRQEVGKIGFWKNQVMRDLLTRTLVRDIDKAGICREGAERDLAQRLVALAKENHENLVRM